MFTITVSLLTKRNSSSRKPTEALSMDLSKTLMAALISVSVGSIVAEADEISVMKFLRIDKVFVAVIPMVHRLQRFVHGRKIETAKFGKQ